MRTRRFSAAALQSLIESFENPMFVLRGECMWAVNEGFLAVVELSREQVVGRSVIDFVHPEERSRLARRLSLRREAGPRDMGPWRYLLPVTGGDSYEMCAQVQEVELEEGGGALLVNCLVMEQRPQGQLLAESLVETSAELVSARSEERVWRVALDGLRGTGFSARLFAREGEGFRALDGASLPADVALGLEALTEGRPVFGGASCGSSHVYLPLGTSLSEVLWVVGEGLGPINSSVLELFAKVVGAALSDARLLADVERGRWEMVAVAEMARFVARPEPPTPEDFLSRLTSLLGADAAVLYSAEEGQLVLSAQVGLEDEARAVLADPSAALGSAASSARSEVIIGEAESRELQRLSGGRLGDGAAVGLSPREQARGLLLVLRPPGHPFESADLRLLGTLSELLVTLLEQRRLRVESSRQLADTRLLLDLARTTAATLEVATILDVAADFLVRLLDVSNCFIMLHDENARVLRGAAASATHRDFFRTVSISLDDAGSVAARAARELRPLVVPDVENEADVLAWEFVHRFEEKALLVLPLTSREELIGVVLVDDTRRPRSFGPAFIELAEATCGQIALAIANARLYESLWASYAELAATRAEMVRRERLAAVVDLSAIVAHEVRNPLGVIFNAVASLRRMLQPEGDTAMLLDILSEESDRLNRMVGDLLDYTRPREVMLQQEDVQQVLKDALEAARGLQLASGGVEFSAEVEPGLPQVPVDRRLLRQALLNVLVNALQSMPQGGTVRVHARLEGRAGRGAVRIDVADQGCGIPNELLHRVFEPFFTTKAQGTGLGLAVVKRILDAHHGEMAVESSPGHGTTFTFRFPLHQPTSMP